MTEIQAEDIIKEVDFNNDGRISFKGFSDAIMGRKLVVERRKNGCCPLFGTCSTCNNSCTCAESSSNNGKDKHLKFSSDFYDRPIHKSLHDISLNF